MKVLVIGSGAIGRGFTGPICSSANAEIDFADNDRELLNKFINRNLYVTAIAGAKGYEYSEVLYNDVFHISELHDLSEYDAVFTSYFMTCQSMMPCSHQ